MNYILMRYAKFVEFLGLVLGKNSEVVLHDVNDLTHSIVAIANGKISGRKIGGSATDLVVDIIKNKKYQGREYLCNYTGYTNKGVSLKSSTFFLRDDNHRIIGLLCINTDCRKLIEARDTLNSLIQPTCTGENITENLNQSADELLKKRIDECMQSVVEPDNTNPLQMSQQEKMEVIRQLYQEGIFNLKGAVAQISSAIQMSEPSVYRYIKIIKKSKNNS